MSRLKADFKLEFFDEQKVIDALDKATRRNLIRQGALLRTIAKRSMRKRKRASQPGQPPSVHSGELKKLLFFSWDASSRSVVVGPVGFKSQPSDPSLGTVPAVLEKGGTVTRAASRRPKRDRGRAVQRVRIAPRPFMVPAMEKSAEKYPDIWKNSVTP